MGTQLPLPKWGTAPNFRFMSVVAKRLDELRMPLGMEVELSPGNIVLDEDPAPPPKKNGHGTPFNCGPTVGHIKMKRVMQVGIGNGHIVLDGNPAPLLQRGTAPQFQFG